MHMHIYSRRSSVLQCRQTCPEQSLTPLGGCRPCAPSNEPAGRSPAAAAGRHPSWQAPQLRADLRSSSGATMYTSLDCSRRAPVALGTEGGSLPGNACTAVFAGNFSLNRMKVINCMCLQAHNCVHTCTRVAHVRHMCHGVAHVCRLPRDQGGRQATSAL